MSGVGETDQDLFAELFVTHQSRVYGFIATMLPNRSEAEEVFQQTSLILWKKWHEYDPQRNFLNWACGVARLAALPKVERAWPGWRSSTICAECNEAAPT